MPGDSLVAGGRSWTRSITVEAPPENVWPWLVQIGVDKAGFYTYDWAERLAMDPVHNADRIHPEWQMLNVGDPVRPMPTGDPWRVEAVQPPSLMVLSGDGGNWSWTTQLLDLPGARTRVVTRMLSTGHGQLGPFLDAADLIVFPRLLVGLKQRAEGTLPGMAGTQVAGPIAPARLPVRWWAGAAWILGLSLAGLLAARRFGLGESGTRRPHPAILGGVAFVAGAGYMIMSDTVPQDLLFHLWPMGIGIASAIGFAIGLTVRPVDAAGRDGIIGRLVQTISEAGLFVVLPAVAVWQIGVALAWTSGLGGHLAIGLCAIVTASAVAGIAWWPRHGWTGAIIAAMLATALVATGSALSVLAAAIIAEVVAGQRRPFTAVPAGPAPDDQRHLAVNPHRS